jgi:uncharacterized protein YjaG (DUF416 family)
MTPPFELDTLGFALDRVSRAHRAVFAAAFAEQLIPSYGICVLVTGWGDESTLREALDVIWNLPGDSGVDEQRVQNLVRRAGLVAPGDRDADQPGQNLRNYWVGPAQDAVSAVTLALQSLLTDDSRLAMRAGQLALNAIRDFLELTTDPFPLPGQAVDGEPHADVRARP